MGMCHEREPRLSSLVVSDSYQVTSSTEICIEFPRRRTPKIMGINVHASNTPQGKKGFIKRFFASMSFGVHRWDP